jgi:uracil phosphoribosyltransferase
MRILIEEALGQEPFSVTRRKTLAGGDYDHYEFENPWDDYCALSIVRSGCSMLPEVFHLMPGIPIAKILIQRDETKADKRPIYYYDKMPKSIALKKRIFIVDPMIGTAGSVICTIKRLQELGVEEERITFINLISCPEGLDRLTSEYPKIKIFTAVLDPVINDSKYIAPGLGDFGDRYFNSN